MKNKNYKIYKNDIPTAIIYTRVSSKEQIDNFSLGTQEKCCLSYAERNGWKVLKIFIEEGESAKTSNRTKLQELLLYIAKNKGKVGKLIVYKMDRFARNAEDHFALKVVLKKYGVELKSATESTTNDPSGELMEVMLAGIAQFDNRIRAQRTLEGMRARLLKGSWSSVAPWGYVNTVDTIGNKIIAPHPERADAIRFIFEKYITGKYTFEEIAKMVNEFGVKSRHGMKMGKQLISKIIVNHIYYGMIVVPRLDIHNNGVHEPIISKELFNKAQEIKNGNGNRNLPHNIDNKDYPLRGLRCEGCGKSISGGRTKGRNQYYEYYGCFNKECKKRTSIKKYEFEKDFTNFLLELTPDEELFDGLKEAIRIAHKSELESVTQSERSIKRKIAELEEKKKGLIDLRIAGKITDDDFTPYNEKLRIEIMELNSSLINLLPSELEIDNVVETSIEFIKHLPTMWRDLDVKDLRVLRNILFPQNLEYTYPKIKTAEIAPIYKLKVEFESNENDKV